MIKVSDYIAKYLSAHGVKDIFMISGGGAMHLNDSFGNSKLKYYCAHNEQALAIEAEGYARLNQDLAAVCVTTGPGGLNCLNGLFGQWTDSVPVIYFSGQVKFSTCKASCPDIPLRQLGDQEADIIAAVKPFTKYAVSITKAKDIKFHLEKAIYLAKNGRPGPVWLDIPINIQAALIDEKKLKGFKIPAKPKYNFKTEQIIKALKKAKAPLIVAGHGIRLASAQNEFKKLAQKLNIPIVTTFNGFDLISEDNPLFAGRKGTVGQRAGNFALQNADCVLFLGTRNNIRQASYNWENFAKKAVKIIVDIDEAELKKPTVKPDIAVKADIKDFIKALLPKAKDLKAEKWLSWCRARVKKYTPLSEFKNLKQKLNPYECVRLITQCSGLTTTVASNATACLALYQAGASKEGKRMFLNSGDASMGYGLPAAIGACIAGGEKETICLEGDGSIMMNLQELQTVKTYNLPIKIFLFNNDGYISIKQTQRNFFGRYTACGQESGVKMPDFIKLAQAFGLRTAQISSPKNLKKQIEKALSLKGPVLCEIVLKDDYIFTPKLSSKKLPDGSMVSPTLEDMFPFLPKEEMEENIYK